VSSYMTLGALKMNYIGDRSNSSLAERQKLNKDYIILPDVLSSIPIDIYVKFSEGLLSNGKECLDQGEIARAYVQYKKFVEFVVNKLPNHQSYAVHPGKRSLMATTKDAFRILETVVTEMDRREDARTAKVNDMMLIDEFDADGGANESSVDLLVDIIGKVTAADHTTTEVSSSSPLPFIEQWRQLSLPCSSSSSSSREGRTTARSLDVLRAEKTLPGDGEEANNNSANLIAAYENIPDLLTLGALPSLNRPLATAPPLPPTATSSNTSLEAYQQDPGVCHQTLIEQNAGIGLR
jgi:USP8 dimerisation domain